MQKENLINLVEFHGSVTVSLSVVPGRMNIHDIRRLFGHLILASLLILGLLSVNVFYKSGTVIIGKTIKRYVQLPARLENYSMDGPTSNQNQGPASIHRSVLGKPMSHYGNETAFAIVQNRTSQKDRALLQTHAERKEKTQTFVVTVKSWKRTTAPAKTLNPRIAQIKFKTVSPLKDNRTLGNAKPSTALPVQTKSSNRNKPTPSVRTGQKNGASVINSTNMAKAEDKENNKTSKQPHAAAAPDTTQKTDSEMVSLNDRLQPMGEIQVSCPKLFAKDKNETLKAKELVKSKPYKKIPLAVLVKATQNCMEYRLARGIVNNVSREERDFPLAYSILVHRSLDQLERLLRAIYRPNNYYCIHVDKKVRPEFMQAVKSLIKCFPNAFIASKLEVVVYAGYTRLQADINCMEDLLKTYPDWKYVLNMAGSEMPLKTNLETVQLLKLYNGTNLVGKNMQARNPWRWKSRFETVVKGLSGNIHKVNTTNIRPPFNLTITKGSAYVILSRAMVKYVLEDPVPKAFLEWNKYTWSPDEQFWATLNNLEHNPQLATPGGNRCRGKSYMQRAVMWYSSACQGKLVHSVCNFGAGDLPWIKARPEFIINKFDLSIDYVALYCMEELLEERKNSTIPWDLNKHKQNLKTHNSHTCG